MEDTKHIHISDYNYNLPDERIAKFPLPVRDQSKLLVYRNGDISETHFTSLPDYIEPGTLMIFNNTKVIQARLHFRKETGALIEISNRTCSMALHDRQPKEMEGRTLDPPTDGKRQRNYIDRHTRRGTRHQPLDRLHME